MYVQQTKFLGVIFDANLTWKPHINHIVLKLHRSSAVISKIRYKINNATALKLYDSMIFSHISLCSIVLAAGINTSKLCKIHIIKKRVLRRVVQAASRSPSKPIFHKLRRLTIFDPYNLHVADFIYSNLNGFISNLFYQITFKSITVFIRITQDPLRSCN